MLGSTLAPIASAQYPVPMVYPMAPPAYPMSPPPMGIPMMPGMAPQTMNPISALNLSAEQREQISAIGQEARSKNVNVMNEIGDKFNKLRELFAAKMPDAQAISSVYGEIFALQQQAIEAAIMTYNKQVEVLNEQQREMFDSMREHMLSQFKSPAESQQ
jgi:Spy/CpxP family protein refolding chaperone